MLSSLMSFISGETQLTDFLLQLFAFLVVIICCFPVHESAHAWMAERLGDSTGRLSGRINMNPSAHLSVWGTVCMVLFGFGYAKPVPVNIRNFPAKKRKKYFALTAVAGPVSNLILAVISMIVEDICAVVAYTGGYAWASIAVNLFGIIAYINIALAVFNLLPIPPLDGSRIWTMLLPDRLYYKFLSYERYMLYILLGLLLFFNRLDFSPLGNLSSLVYSGLENLIWLPFKAILSVLA